MIKKPTVGEYIKYKSNMGGIKIRKIGSIRSIDGHNIYLVCSSGESENPADARYHVHDDEIVETFNKEKYPELYL